MHHRRAPLELWNTYLKPPVALIGRCFECIQGLHDLAAENLLEINPGALSGVSSLLVPSPDSGSSMAVLILQQLRPFPKQTHIHRNWELEF